MGNNLYNNISYYILLDSIDTEEIILVQPNLVNLLRRTDKPIHWGLANV